MTDYGSLKVAELKDLVKERGIAATGLKLKQQFVEALEADDTTKADGDGVGGGGGGDEDGGGRSNASQAAVEQTEEEAAAAQGDAHQDETGAERAEARDAHVIDVEGTNKRKRRSPTPPLSEETVNKKLRTADGEVHVKLPEDVAEDAPVPVNEAESTKTIQPYGSSDDVMQVDEIKAEKDIEEAQDTAQEPVREKADAPAAESDAMQDIKMEHDDMTAPAKHSATRALYVRGLVRPLQPNHLREHLHTIASPPNNAPTGTDIVEQFHLDKLRTHALVCFDSISSASRARSALHDRIWPDEPMRKPLWVDFIPDEKIEEWISTETARPDTRWEVVYEATTGDTDGPVVATLQEASSSGGRQASFSGDMRPSTRSSDAPSGQRRRASQSPEAPAQQERPAQSKSFDSLDARYSFTETKPKIYYQPVAKDLADRRLDQFDEGTSRDWDDQQADPSLYGEGELRRYTFEDGDRLVDGGADFGLFGRRSTRGGRGGGPPRGGRGRGGGGGGGDYYRGGGGRR